MSLFKLHLPFQPAGDQPAAIEKLQQGLGKPSTLLGVTGSGKTFTIANVIAAQNNPVIVLSTWPTRFRTKIKLQETVQWIQKRNL